MPEKNGLFYAFNLRFSFLKSQHMELLQKLEKESELGRKSKTQIIMDALEVYYEEQEKAERNEDAKKYISVDQLDNVRNEMRAEVYQECMRMFAGNTLARATNVLPQGGEMNQQSSPDKTAKEQDDYDIESDEVVMSNIARWS